VRLTVSCHIRAAMNDKEHDQKLKLFKSALDYITGKLAEGKKGDGTSYPLNRGDVIILVTLIEQELQFASSDWTDPLNAKRLAAIREKLGSMAGDAPQMSKAEAQQFRE
jgi:hypothetical protein